MFNFYSKHILPDLQRKYIVEAILGTIDSVGNLGNI